MRITAEEKLMYAVMKAIYDSGIPWILMQTGIPTPRRPGSKWSNRSKERFKKAESD